MKTVPYVVFSFLMSRILPIVIFSLTLLIPVGALKAQTFAPPVNYTAGSMPVAVAVADLNGDAKRDVVVANNTSQNVSVLLGNGDGTFGAKTDYDVGTNANAVTIADFNGDGKPDIATANSFSNTSNVSVLFGVGNGTFQPRADYPLGDFANSNSIASGDFNGDSKPDLLTANQGGGASVLLNRGDGTFNPRTNYDVGSFATSAVVGDFNGDGKLDFAVSSYGGASITSVVLGNGDGTFHPPVAYAAGPSPFTLTAADLDGDGKLDLVSGNIQASSISVLRGNGDGTFLAAINYPAGSTPLAISTGDMNSDGKLDIVIANGGGGMTVLQGNGNTSFRGPINYLAGMSSIAVADFNSDNKPDVAGTTLSAVSILLNQTGPFQISGRIAEASDLSVSNVSVVLTGATPVSTLTAADGTYSFIDLPAGGNFVVTPSKANYIFIPASWSINGLSQNESANFLASLSLYLVNGVVRDQFGAGIKDVLVTLSGTISSATLTADDGSYSFGPLPGGGHYSLTASRPGIGFSPPSSTITNLSAPRSVLFTASAITFRISGNVRDTTTGLGLSGAFVSLSGSASAIATPSFDGSYSFVGLAAGGSYTVSVSTFQPGALFSRSLLNPPLSQTFANLNSDVTANFSGTTLVSAASINPTNLSVGDFNADGRPDIAAGGGGPNGVIKLLMGNGSGIFAAPIDLPIGCTPNAISTADFNRDGKIDIASASYCFMGQSRVSILLGDGNGNFSSANNYVVDVNPLAMTLNDFNGDGIPDVVTANSNINVTISVLLGVGDGTFGNATTFQSVRISSLVSGDFNGDGKIDLAAANSDSNNLKVLFGNGNGTFQTATDLQVPSHPMQLAVADLNGDGKLDLVSTNPGTNNVSVFLGNATGGFNSPLNFNTGAGPNAIKIADINGDGKLDLAVGTSDTLPLSILFGNGDGTFQNSISNPTNPGGPGVLAIADFNLDGKNDVAMPGSGSVVVLLNVRSSAAPVSINGQVKTPAGDPIAGVTVSITGSQTGTTMTDSSGNYSFNNLPVGGTYSIGLSKILYNFTPPGLTFNNLISDQIANFTGALAVVNIVGRVTDANGGGLAGVNLNLTGSQTASVVSNQNGTYAFTNLTAGGNYVVTPSFTAGSFTPANRTFNSMAVTSIADFRSSLARTVQLEFSAFTVDEGTEAALVAVTRSGDLSAPATVEYMTSDDSANQGRDYTGAFGTLPFAPGENRKTLIVLITDNGYVDGSRTVRITLKNPSAATFGLPYAATLTINDNDTAPSAGNPVDDARYFVREHYYDFLNRTPDPGGLDYWTGNITQCGTDVRCIHNRRIDVSAAFFIELEFQETGYVVYRFHRAAFGTWPNTSTRVNMTFAQFMADRGQLVAGSGLPQSTESFANGFVQRTEFLQTYPVSQSNAQFVNQLFDTAGLTPFTTERQQEIDAMNNNGKTRAQVLLDVIEIPTFKTREYNGAFVLMQYFGYLRRDPDQGGYDFWLDVLNNRVPGNFRGMVCAF
ncbi:MAG TPA: FG-GAP-like repeat-containing protein, partial [Pyrinomonadaceae bacterium]|nr:FG-GAP-like repeat-containing protein [Pyrinomonadaceae bacterium]